MFSILIHADLHQALRAFKRDLRSRIRKTLLRLQAGHWAGGTRVKRLRGANRPVFEARTDRGDRLLFTAIRSADPSDPERLATYLQVWDVVSHDAVDRVIRRNMSAEAEFLEFHIEEQFDIEVPPPEPAARFDSLAAEDGADPLLHFLLPPHDYSPPAEEGITGAVRWFQTSAAMLADDEEFQRIIDHDGGGLELKLTREQYNVLLAPGPALVAGSAGSGKTTIAVHRLADGATASPPLRSVYLSYSPWLVDHARKLYHDVMSARSAAPPAVDPHFTTFTDLYRRILPAEDALVDAADFRSWFVRSGLRLDPALVWEEIRSIIKGACTNIGKVMLDEQEYLELGRKRAPLFVDERPEIYRIALRYQQWLVETQRVDQIDLCRRAFRELRRGHHKRYDAVICDEVQDLTEIEIGFVLALSADASFGRIMLSGDTQQIVNPSGFRWAEVRQTILKATRGTKAPPLLRLRRNFRSVRPVVELANSVIALRREIYGRSDEDDPEEAALEGPVPIQILDSDKKVLEAVRDFGPRCAVIVFSGRDRDALQRELESTRIFHVQEAKGLEFDTVILWKALSADEELINRFLRIDRRLERDARFRLFLQHLYVALTRARRHVALFEGSEPHPFWNSGHFENRAERETAPALARLFRESASAADWIREAGYYFERQRYRQAAECYRRGGQPAKESEALALFAESVGDWIAALKRWEGLGNIERQAPALERMSRFEEALAIYRRLGQTEKVATLEIHQLERQGRWAEAGQRWEALERRDEAARCYHRSGDRARALSFEAIRAEGEKNWAHAAECWWEIKSWESAARCFRKAKNTRSAALSTAMWAESRRDWTAAASAFRKAGERRRSDECRVRAYEAEGKLKEAAKLWERLDHPNEALRLYRKLGDSAAVDRVEVGRINVQENVRPKVLSFMKAGKPALAFRLASSRRAAIRAQMAKRPPLARRVELGRENRELQLDQSCCRAMMAEIADDWSKAAHHWRRAGEYDKARSAEVRAAELLTDVGERARAWMDLGEWQRAVECYQQAGDREGELSATAGLLQSQGDWASAAVVWSELGDRVRAEYCYNRSHGYRRTPEKQPRLFSEPELC
jgi:DNA helicase II / ATP-dependent DNA helicase PcrA